MIKITEYMSKPVITISRTESIRQATVKMDNHNIGSLVVTDHRRPVGIVTERDVLRKAVAKKLDLDKVPVEKIMTKRLQTITEQASLIEVASLMKTHTLRRLIVVNKKGEISGIVTSKDLIDILTN